MRRIGLTAISTSWALALVLSGCGGGSDDGDTGADETGDQGDGDGDTGDGDGDSGDGDGDGGDGDGDGDSGDGDGDGDEGDGDGDEGDGDGDGDEGDGDGDEGDGDGDEGDGDGDGGDGDGDGTCDGPGVGACEEPPDSDSFNVDGLSIIDDCLHVEVSYGGGCEVHTYDPCWDGSFAESNPVQATLWIDHDAMNDACDAFIEETWIIDLTEIKTAWQDAYQSQSGSIILHIENDSIQYDF